MKPNPFIFLIGNNVVCALLLIALFFVVIDWLQGSQQSPLTITSLFALSIYSLYANRRVTAYQNFQSEWDAISEKQPQLGRKRIAVAIFLWLVLVYMLLTTPRESDPEFYDVTLGIFILFTSWGCYLLLRALPGLAVGLFKRRNSNGQGHIAKDYIVSHRQSVPKSTSAATQINQQLPDYCKELLERK